MPTEVEALQAQTKKVFDSKIDNSRTQQKATMNTPTNEQTHKQTNAGQSARQAVHQSKTATHLT